MLMFAYQPNILANLYKGDLFYYFHALQPLNCKSISFYQHMTSGITWFDALSTSISVRMVIIHFNTSRSLKYV